MVPRRFRRVSAILALIAGLAYTGEAGAQGSVAVAGNSATPAADSVAELNRIGKWTDAATLARITLNGQVPIDEQCGLFFGLAYSDVRLGRLDDAKPLLDHFVERCRIASATQYLTSAMALHREVTLPPIPRTGLDFSAVDAFWHVADLLVADKEPSENEWMALFATTGNRLAIRFAPSLRSDLEIALRPSRRATLDSLAKAASAGFSSRPEHLARIYADRAALTAFRDSVAKSLPVERATTVTSRFLPPHATEGGKPPLVAFAFFTDDAYPVGTDAIVVDLEHVRVSTDLTLLLAHEFHHAFLAGLNALTYPSGPDASVTLVRALGTARTEGIADLIDKPYPVTRAGPNGEAYAKMYNESYARTPDVIRSIDSALVVAAGDSTKLQEVGVRVGQLLPSGGHFNGSYMAREIYETFGVDSLFPGVRNPFAFWRAYGEAEIKRGKPSPFSAQAIVLLGALETKYRAPAAPRAAPFEF